jgi:hypothetical protein
MKLGSVLTIENSMCQKMALKVQHEQDNRLELTNT